MTRTITLNSDQFTPSIDAARRMQSLARIGRLYLATHYCPAPMTKTEVEQHRARLAELGRLCREIGGGE